MRPFWRRRLLLPTLVLLALNVGTYLAYTHPRTLRERAIAAGAVVLRQEVAEERALVEGVRQRARTMDANTADVTRFYKALGPKDSLLKVQEDIVGVARQLGLTLGSRSYSNESVKGSDSLARFRINVPISGSYRQVVSFLQRIEALPHFVTVDSISLREDSDPGRGRSANLNVVLSVYFLATESGDDE